VEKELYAPSSQGALVGSWLAFAFGVDTGDAIASRKRWKVVRASDFSPSIEELAKRSAALLALGDGRALAFAIIVGIGMHAALVTRWHSRGRTARRRLGLGRWWTREVRVGRRRRGAHAVHGKTKAQAPARRGSGEGVGQQVKKRRKKTRE